MWCDVYLCTHSPRPADSDNPPNTTAPPDVVTSALQNQLQQTLGDAYRLERELGGGGMSRVFVAEELRLARRVVAKVLSPDLGYGISADRFEREIRTVAALQQANIVP